MLHSHHCYTVTIDPSPKVSCNVHYFEDGNVQLEDRIVFFAEVHQIACCQPRSGLCALRYGSPPQALLMALRVAPASLVARCACDGSFPTAPSLHASSNRSHSPQVSCLPSEVGKAVADQVRTFECGFIAKMEEIYQNMSETVLQGLRRRLPVTRTKYDWDKLAVGRLAAEMTGLNAGK